KQSTHEHTTAAAAALTLLLILQGCYIARESGVQVFVAPCGQTGTNGTAAVSFGDFAVSPHQAASLQGHPVAIAITILAALALITAVIWVVHNRGKLAGTLASLALKL